MSTTIEKPKAKILCTKTIETANSCFEKITLYFKEENHPILGVIRYVVLHGIDRESKISFSTVVYKFSLVHLRGSLSLFIEEKDLLEACEWYKSLEW